RPGALCTWFFQTIRADVMVLTMLDLQNFHLKRSVHPVHYAYVFHSMGSTHMVDHASSYDHYDSLLCVGPHHVAEIRRREELHRLPPKHLFAHGYPRLERLVALAGDGEPAPAPRRPAARTTVDSRASASPCSSSTCRPASGTRTTPSSASSPWRCASGASSGPSCRSTAWPTRRATSPSC